LWTRNCQKNIQTIVELLKKRESNKFLILHVVILDIMSIRLYYYTLYYMIVVKLFKLKNVFFRRSFVDKKIKFIYFGMNDSLAVHSLSGSPQLFLYKKLYRINCNC